MKSRPLPPLNSLIAFEAAARHLSFTRAALELSVTQGAVSRQVKLLEDYLGQTLFERKTREIALSYSGNLYYQRIHALLSELADATGEIRQWQGERQITVMTTSAMAALWLLPRVADFQKAHGDVDLRIIARDDVTDHARLECDLALYYCQTPPARMKVTPLFAEEVFPVCSPAYLAAHPHIASLDQLAASTWLWLDIPQRGWMGWPQWFEHLGHVPQVPRHRVKINSYSMLIQSAISGQGVALAWSNLLGDSLAAGTLVRPFEVSVKTEARFCLLEQPSGPGRRPLVESFRDWVLLQVAQTHEENSCLP